MPKILVDVTTVDMTTSILGVKVSSPICIAPTAMQRMAHPDGECATSRAAAKHDTLMTLSSWSTTALEDVAAAGGPGKFRYYFTSLHFASLALIMCVQVVPAVRVQGPSSDPRPGPPRRESVRTP